MDLSASAVIVHWPLELASASLRRSSSLTLGKQFLLLSHSMNTNSVGSVQTTRMCSLDTPAPPSPRPHPTQTICAYAKNDLFMSHLIKYLYRSLSYYSCHTTELRINMVTWVFPDKGYRIRLFSVNTWTVSFDIIWKPRSAVFYIWFIQSVFVCKRRKYI